MKAPVAANRLNFAFTKKNTSSGPSSVASLNSGCGWVLSITCGLGNPTGTQQNLRFRQWRAGEIARGERREIVDAFADADEVHRQFELFRERHQDAAARGAVELRSSRGR